MSLLRSSFSMKLPPKGDSRVAKKRISGTGISMTNISLRNPADITYDCSEAPNFFLSVTKDQLEEGFWAMQSPLLNCALPRLLGGHRPAVGDPGRMYQVDG